MVDELTIESVAISALGPGPLREVSDLINRANYAYPRIFPGDRTSPARFTEVYGDCLVLVARHAAQAVATVTVATVGDALKVYVLAAAPEAQGRGLGALMLRAAETEARARGLRNLELDAVETGNLVSYYVRSGFEEISRKTMPIGQWGAQAPFELVTLRRHVSE